MRGSWVPRGRTLEAGIGNHVHRPEARAIADDMQEAACPWSLGSNPRTENRAVSENAHLAITSNLSVVSTAPGCTAAILALVAGAVGHHQHATLGACWRAFVGI